MPPALQRHDLLEDRDLRGRAFAQAWTERIEDWLRDVFEEASGGAGTLALVALGGQGRREMAPQSDLDLLLLFDPATAPDGVAEKLWYPIWDAGLKLGHSVRTVRDTLALAADDLETATSLLSARHIAGNRALTTELTERSRAAWRRKGRSWLEQLARATDERHAVAGEVAFALEPDLKEGRGGLRDVHALGWAELAGAPVDAYLTPEILSEHDVLLDVRVELHRSQARPGDKLLLQEQDYVAARLGDADADSLMARVAEAGRAIAFSSDEAWHDIKTGLNGTFFGRFRRDRRIDRELVLRDARVALADESIPITDPFACLRVADVAARERVRISTATLDLLAEAPDPPDPWPDSARDQFSHLLLAGPAAVGVIETLDRWGLWTRLIPEWAPAQSRPQRNAFHLYTVDRHLLETAAEAAGLVQLAPRPDLLVVGALLHDLGKAYPERGDHSVVGADLARGVAARMGFSDHDVETIVCLVRHHLLLPDVATRRDVGDPATCELVAREVGTIDRVALLRALSEADALATGPTAWSPWKAQLIDVLATRTVELLEGGPEAVSATPEFPTPAQRELLEGDDVRVECEGERITVACADRLGVFSRVAGALALHGLDVVEANIHSEGNRALDEFRVRAGPSGVVPWDRVTADVVRVLEGRLALQARIEERARSHARRHRAGIHQFQPSVRFDSGNSATTSVIEVIGPDSVGLLYRLARALVEFDLNVTGARIHTVGHDVVDSFYVSGPDGERVEDPELQGEIRKALLNALEVPV